MLEKIMDAIKGCEVQEVIDALVFMLETFLEEKCTNKSQLLIVNRLVDKFLRIKRYKNPSGRAGCPSLYRPEIHDNSIKEILGSGGCIDDFCKQHSLNKHTYGTWRYRKPTFAMAIRMGKDIGGERRKGK